MQGYARNIWCSVAQRGRSHSALFFLPHRFVSQFLLAPHSYSGLCSTRSLWITRNTLFVFCGASNWCGLGGDDDWLGCRRPSWSGGWCEVIVQRHGCWVLSSWIKLSWHEMLLADCCFLFSFSGDILARLQNPLCWQGMIAIMGGLVPMLEKGFLVLCRDL